MKETCPQCNQRATKRQVRRLFATLSTAGCVSESISGDKTIDLEMHSEPDTPRTSSLARENAALKRKLAELETRLSQPATVTHTAQPRDGLSAKFGRSIVVDGTPEAHMGVVASVQQSGSQSSAKVIHMNVHAGESVSPDEGLRRHTISLDVNAESVRCIISDDLGGVLLGTSSGDVLRWDRIGDVADPILRLPGCAIWSLKESSGSMDADQVIIAGDSKGRVHIVRYDQTECLQVSKAPIHSLCIVANREDSCCLVAASVVSMCVVDLSLENPGSTRVVDISASLPQGVVCVTNLDRILAVSYRNSQLASHEVFILRSDYTVVRKARLTGHVNKVSMIKTSMLMNMAEVSLVSPCESHGTCMWKFSLEVGDYQTIEALVLPRLTKSTRGNDTISEVVLTPGRYTPVFSSVSQTRITVSEVEMLSLGFMDN